MASLTASGLVVVAQAESVAELINARTVVAADAAVAGLTGGLSSTVVRLRSTLLTLLANVEVLLPGAIPFLFMSANAVVYGPLQPSGSCIMS